ncbi:Protein of unknown function [Gryllus bimaculatus]|nr:Protein of unknown function [Gryllus bimaculatus]
MNVRSRNNSAMSAVSRDLWWMAAGLLLCSWKVTAWEWPVESDSDAPTAPPAPVGQQGYRRYFANDSLIGRPVPCTREDKICFRHNLVYYPSQERCDYIGRYFVDCYANSGCYCKLTVNRTELEFGSGRLVGSCPKYMDPCSGYRMAYDDKCYKKKIVQEVICGADAEITVHILGDMECRDELFEPISIQQPEEDGSCVVPDLRNPDIERSAFLHNPLESFQKISKEKIPSFACEPSQAECFDKEKVWVSGYDGCHTLLKQGPCPDDHLVALDVQAAFQGRAEGVCAHVRGGCPKGYKRMLFDGDCHEDREIAIQVPGKITLNQDDSTPIRNHNNNNTP